MFNRHVTPVLAAVLALTLAGCQSPATTAAAPTAAAVAAEPPNLFLLKQEIKAYIDRGDYDAGLARVGAEAKAWIEQRAAQGGKLAVVFDIDETTISNLRHMREMDFGYVPALWDQWVAEADGPPIAPLLEVYRTARARGVTVFFMTGRKTTDAPGTLKNLRDVGYGDYADVYFKPNEYRDTTQSFKTAMRKKITESGYTIIANIGDQQSDLDGGYAERTFKLPNPFYITK
jgi:predicted secreted acid phosphatase